MLKNYFVKSSKYVTFTKFLSKKCDSKFLQFPHCVSLEKIFLKLIYIVPRHGLLVKKLISRNFSKKSGKENFRNLHNCAQHTVEITEFYFHGLSQKFRQINDLLKNFTINWFDGKICVTVNFLFFHTESSKAQIKSRIKTDDFFVKSMRSRRRKKRTTR